MAESQGVIKSTVKNILTHLHQVQGTRTEAFKLPHDPEGS